MSRASLWGRRLPEYSSTYDTVGAAHMFSFNADEQISLHIDGVTSIRDICRLVGNKTGSELEIAADQIPMSTLRSVLDFAYSPHTFRNFGSPPLISACIRLMSTVKLSGKSAPFSFEYGYLCYRIVSLALGVCILQRTNEFDTAVADMVSDPGTTPLQVLSEHVSRVLCGVIGSTPDNKPCDYILGWAQLKNFPNQKPLVARSDASMLLDLLYGDRKHFLQSLTLTYPPVLSGVFFLIWRNWCFERVIRARRDAASLTEFVSPIYDLLYRSCLVVTTDQERSLAFMHNALGEDAHLWKEKMIDVEDCRTVVEALNNRLVRTEDGFLFDPLDPMVIPILLKFLTPFVKHGAKDLYPALLRSVATRMSEFLVNKSSSVAGPPVVDILRDIFKSLKKVLESIQPVSSEVGSQIIHAAIDSELLGLVVCGMIMLKPIVKGTSREEMARNGSFLEGAAALFQAICSIVPEQVIKSKFHDTFQDWLKYAMYIYWKVHMSRGERKHWDVCGQYLQYILRSIQQEGQRDALGEDPRHCSYARCPDPYKTGFACSACLKVYCSMRCQAADWINENWQTPHRESCDSDASASE